MAISNRYCVATVWEHLTAESQLIYLRWVRDQQTGESLVQWRTPNGSWQDPTSLQLQDFLDNIHDNWPQVVASPEDYGVVGVDALPAWAATLKAGADPQQGRFIRNRLGNLVPAPEGTTERIVIAAALPDGRPADVFERLARKLEPTRFSAMSGKMGALVAYMLDRKWTSPQIDDVGAIGGGLVAAQHAGDVGYNDILGTTGDLRDNFQRLFAVAELDTDEMDLAKQLYATRFCRVWCGYHWKKVADKADA